MVLLVYDIAALSADTCPWPLEPIHLDGWTWSPEPMLLDGLTWPLEPIHPTWPPKQILWLAGLGPRADTSGQLGLGPGIDVWMAQLGPRS